MMKKTPESNMDQNMEDYILDTGRLQLRAFRSGDAPFIIELLNSPGWLQFIGDRNVKTISDALRYLEDGPMRSYKENGFGLWLVQKKDGGMPVGMCGLVKRETLEHPDIGFAFLPQYQGGGYAYETAAATLEYAFNALKIHYLLAVTLPENIKSIQLLSKLQFQFIRTVSFRHNGEILNQYGRSLYVLSK